MWFNNKYHDNVCPKCGGSDIIHCCDEEFDVEEVEDERD
jgi:hypothetical protein